jgi:hypothetical protein
LDGSRLLLLLMLQPWSIHALHASNGKTGSTHVVVTPPLVTPVGLKQLWKACGVALSVPAGSIGWATNACEPVLTGVCFPFVRVNPWQLRMTPKMFCVEGNVRWNVQNRGGGPKVCSAQIFDQLSQDANLVTERGVQNVMLCLQH